tara:strand:- start:186 stop:455 length:270 start_codon:yes stop_codon:yes gene_type:complete
MTDKKKQESLFENMDDLNYWSKHWKNMPEFKNEDKEPFQSIKVHFATKEDREQFSKLIDQPITDKTIYVHLPKKTFKPIDYLYIDQDES